MTNDVARVVIIEDKRKQNEALEDASLISFLLQEISKTNCSIFVEERKKRCTDEYKKKLEEFEYLLKAVEEYASKNYLMPRVRRSGIYFDKFYIIKLVNGELIEVGNHVMGMSTKKYFSIPEDRAFSTYKNFIIPLDSIRKNIPLDRAEKTREYLKRIDELMCSAIKDGVDAEFLVEMTEKYLKNN